MKSKLKKMAGYTFYIIMSNFLYGILLYFVLTWLLKYSELYAHLGNLVFIIIGLFLDKWIVHKVFQPQKLAERIKKIEKEEDRELNNRVIRWQLRYFVSFKTSLFFFYIFVLLFSQIINLNPEIVSFETAKLIHLIDYGVIVLLAFKDFGEEFSKDRNRMSASLEEYDKCMSNHKL